MCNKKEECGNYAGICDSVEEPPHGTCFKSNNKTTENQRPVGSFEFPGSATKPPLGLRPKRIADWQRRTEIVEAMERYGKAGKEIPEQWFDELKELLAVA